MSCTGSIDISSARYDVSAAATESRVSHAHGCLLLQQLLPARDQAKLASWPWLRCGDDVIKKTTRLGEAQSRSVARRGKSWKQSSSTGLPNVAATFAASLEEEAKVAMPPPTWSTAPPTASMASFQIWNISQPKVAAALCVPLLMEGGAPLQRPGQGVLGSVFFGRAPRNHTFLATTSLVFFYPKDHAVPRVFF